MLGRLCTQFRMGASRQVGPQRLECSLPSSGSGYSRFAPVGIAPVQFNQASDPFTLALAGKELLLRGNKCQRLRRVGLGDLQR